MAINKPDDTDDVHAAIGHAVSCLLKSGDTAGTEEIVAFLERQQAGSVNGQREVYVRAVRAIMQMAS